MCHLYKLWKEQSKKYTTRMGFDPPFLFTEYCITFPLLIICNSEEDKCATNMIKSLSP